MLVDSLYYPVDAVASDSPAILIRVLEGTNTVSACWLPFVNVSGVAKKPTNYSCC
jgi:hypothetical protein